MAPLTPLIELGLVSAPEELVADFVSAPRSHDLVPLVPGVAKSVRRVSAL